MFSIIKKSNVEIDWTKQHCGTFLTDYDNTIKLMPDVEPILLDLRQEVDLSNYVFDVKVHKLMPGEWPCIPNWHMDFVPRDLDYKKRPDLVTGEPMFIWVSGEPVTEFKDQSGIYKAPEKTWISFTQKDLHKGCQSTIHTWRGFIRAIPKIFIHEGITININEKRRHSQVYLDANKFTW